MNGKKKKRKGEDKVQARVGPFVREDVCVCVWLGQRYKSPQSPRRSSGATYATPTPATDKPNRHNAIITARHPFQPVQNFAMRHRVGEEIPIQARQRLPTTGRNRLPGQWCESPQSPRRSSGPLRTPHRRLPRTNPTDTTRSTPPAIPSDRFGVSPQSGPSNPAIPVSRDCPHGHALPTREDGHPSSEGSIHVVVRGETDPTFNF